MALENNTSGLDNKISGFLKFQINRKIVNLYKNYLLLLEDLQDPPYNIPKDKQLKIRKRILDLGNDAIREIEQDLDKVNVSLKQ